MRKYRKYVVWYLLAGYSGVLAVGIWSTINFPTVAYPWLRTSVGPLIFPFAYYWSLFYVLVPTELVVRRKAIDVRSYGSARRIEHKRILEVGLDDSQEPHIFWFRYNTKRGDERDYATPVTYKCSKAELLELLAYYPTDPLSHMSATSTPSPGAPAMTTPMNSKLSALFAAHSTPTIHLAPADTPNGIALGGLPPAHRGFEWPRNENGVPQTLVASVDLARLPETFDWLPREGLLLFFYDQEQWPWGSDIEEFTGWKVLHVETSTLTGGDAATPPELTEEHRYPAKPLRPVVVSLPPTLNGDRFDDLEDISDEQLEAYDEAREAVVSGQPNHQIGGYPKSQQDDTMEEQCAELLDELLNARGESTTAPNPGDWKLLLQIDSDEDLEMMWGDCGLLYFWIRKQDAMAKDFSKVWMHSQCG